MLFRSEYRQHLGAFGITVSGLRWIEVEREADARVTGHDGVAAYWDTFGRSEESCVVRNALSSTAAHLASR